MLVLLGACGRPPPRGPGQFEPSLAAASDGFAVAWYEETEGSADIYYRWLDADGRPRGSPYRLTSDSADSYEPDIVAFGGNVAVAWYDRDASTKKSMAQLGVWTAAGEPVWTRQLSGSGDIGRNPVVRTYGDNLFCAWLEYKQGARPEVHAQWFDASGTPRSAPRLIASAGKTTWNLNAAIDEAGRAWVAFDATVDTRADELFVASLDDDAVRVTRISADDGHDSRYPDLRFANGRIALTWFDERDGNEEVYLFIGPTQELDHAERQAQRVTRTAGHSVGAYLAWNGDTVGLAWCDDTLGNYDVYFRQFGQSGQPMGSARRLTDGGRHAWVPAIQPSEAGFALVWSSGVEEATHEVAGRGKLEFRVLGDEK